MKRAPRPRSRFRRIVREIAFLTVVVGLLLSARSSLADHYRVPTGSMIPTVEVGDRVIVNKAAYGLRVPFTDAYITTYGGPYRGDVVVLDSPEDDKVLLKRVVGLPGDVISVRDGRILLNRKPVAVYAGGDALHERLGDRLHAVRLDHGGGSDYGPVEIAEGRYLVMGDNRGLSHDGREFGLVERRAIFGRAVAVYWRHGPVWQDL